MLITTFLVLAHIMPLQCETFYFMHSFFFLFLGDDTRLLWLE